MSERETLPADFNLALWQDQISKDCVANLGKKYFLIPREWFSVLILVLPLVFGLIGTVLSINATLKSAVTRRVEVISAPGSALDRIEDLDRHFAIGTTPAQELIVAQKRIDALEIWRNQLTRDLVDLSNRVAQLIGLLSKEKRILNPNDGYDKDCIDRINAIKDRMNRLAFKLDQLPEGAGLKTVEIGK